MMLDVTGDGLDDLVVPTVPWNAATHSESPTTDWTITPNRGVSPPAGAKFFQSPVVAYSEDHNDIDNDPVLQQQPDLKVQPDYGTPIDYNQDGLTDVLVHNVHGTALGFPDTWGVLLATAQHTFTLQDTKVPRPKHLIDEKFRLGNQEASVHLADVNGDGIADLLQCERDETAGGAGAYSWQLPLLTPAGPGSRPHRARGRLPTRPTMAPHGAPQGRASRSPVRWNPTVRANRSDAIVRSGNHPGRRPPAARSASSIWNSRSEACTNPCANHRSSSEAADR